ncbi:putative MFS-type transporter [Mycobacterium marinum]|nr:putative MFS-type transporter [Mycobacterium marinum]GJO21366.1 putative MFS-type transporter [Mycobacterium marinum]GJO34483.1 putative MFS-type transporter [Mycobacterium marinum]GJO57641.1 putative MFS-type transporter [Mycobacterium marinum]GJO69819.1 putative MFS-type transporter [Mycobacterium marinum]
MTRGETERAVPASPGIRCNAAPVQTHRDTLWAIAIGIFMTSVDDTVVYVANPSIMAGLNTSYHMVIWVTSGYVLAYTVPSLVAGRLGDRFGVKNLYLAGLAVFTVSSLWCGVSGTIEILIAARVAQGIGAALLYTQTFTIVTRAFPPERRGAAATVWAAAAGFGNLVGPLLGGALVDTLGWQWIFFVNVPVGIVGLVLAVRFVPALPTHTRRFDLIGVGLSGLGLLLIVFGLQQGHAAGWSPWIWAMIVVGVGFVTVFVYWQSVNTSAPLIPLRIFGDRNFALCSFGVAVIAFVAAAMMLPGVFYMQTVRGLSPTRTALLMAPLPIVVGLLTPFIGKILDRAHPRAVAGFGFSVVAISLIWFSIEMAPATPVWRLAVPIAFLGVGMVFAWPVLTVTATRDLPAELVGASSGVYNAARALGATLGSAGMAALMTSRIAAQAPAIHDDAHTSAAAATEGVALQLPEFAREPFSAAMSQSLLLPALIALLGVGAALLMSDLRAPRSTLAQGL